jgi:hypothetical protein
MPEEQIIVVRKEKTAVPFGYYSAHFETRDMDLVT